MSPDNIIVDSYVKSFLYAQVLSGWLPSPIPLNEGWWVLVQGLKLASVDTDKMYSQLWDGDLKKYWYQKFTWAASTTALVDWSILGECFGPLPFSQCRMTTKLANGQLGVGCQMHRYSFQDHDHCPCCNFPNEDTSHVLLC